MTTTTGKSYAPWTVPQATSLNHFQVSGVMHPFTCPRRGELPHRDTAGDVGVLVALVSGWTCVDCNYRQDWAWQWMVDGSWRQMHTRRSTCC